MKNSPIYFQQCRELGKRGTLFFPFSKLGIKCAAGVVLDRVNFTSLVKKSLCHTTIKTGALPLHDINTAL